MKLKKLSILLLSAVVLAGCSSSNGGAQDSTTTAETTTETETTTTETTSTEETTVRDAANPTTEDQDLYATLIEDEYDGLEVTAEILQRNAIIPGSTIPVTVVIANNGEKSIAYVQGSGTFATPQALDLSIDGLQPVLAQDHLGPATMDYVTKELKPGEELKFIMNLKAIEPNEDFETYTYELFNQDQVYIADMNIDELFEQYSDLTPAAAGTYEGTVRFIYQVLEGADGNVVFGDATGYNEAPISITITE